MAALITSVAFVTLLAIPGAPAAESAGRPAHRQPATRQEPPPRILLDQSPRAIEYQISRLTNDELARVERQPGDPKCRPIYAALLTRKGLARSFRDEAVSALTKIDSASPTKMLLQALSGLREAEDDQTAAQLLDMLLAQPSETLRAERAIFAAARTEAHPFALQGAYGAMMIADGSPAAAWEAAAKEGHLAELLRVVPRLDKYDELRTTLFPRISALLDNTTDAGTRAAALAALPFTRRNAAVFDLLAREVIGPSPAANASTRAAAVSALQLIPDSAWTKGTLEPLARALVEIVRGTPPEHRTDPGTIAAVYVGEKFAAALPDEPRRAVRRDLRALGVRVITIETVPEQLLFNVKWFVVEAGKPVQVVLSNPDGMPHNLVVGQPGSVRDIGTAGAAVPPTSDPNGKPYVPDIPLVVAATRLLNGGEFERLNFTAPAKAGEYVYLCSFPGHWIRMYGVMLVVDSLEAWEARPTEPTDPLTSQPMGPQRR
jgi:azurin/DNA-binding transcriptional ArsR family regulator